MLFTTADFAFVFLPITLIAFFVVARYSNYWAAASLCLASIVFYSVSMPMATILLLFSIVLNFAIGRAISQNAVHAKTWLIAGIVADLAILAYFKYAGFLVGNVESLIGRDFGFDAPALPVGISFFTFTQIAYLVDTYKRKVTEYSPVHYGLFVTFFPHLVAGPVLHHAQMMPQFQKESTYRLSSANFALGLSIFAIGLFKKVVIADGISPYADAVFDAAAAGKSLTLIEGWAGALAYTFQLYFDFSGYSDMAIGLSWMCNIRLPFNFDSPYKARNISEFWRRWHISLSTFLRDYLYIAMGGNRHGRARRYFNLFITMLLGGLWHGASWTFVFWGALHGIYLMIHHAFSALAEGTPMPAFLKKVGHGFGWLATFVAVIVGWVFFRATSFDAAQSVLTSMSTGWVDWTARGNAVLWNAGLHLDRVATLCAILLLAVVALPNSNRIGERLQATFEKSRRWSFFAIGAAALAMVLFVVVNESRDTASAFIYFNF